MNTSGGWIYTAAALLFACSAVAFTIEPMNLASLGTTRTVSPEQIDLADSLNSINCAQIDETDFWLCKGPQFLDSRTGTLHRIPQATKRKPSMLAYSSRPNSKKIEDGDHTKQNGKQKVYVFSRGSLFRRSRVGILRKGEVIPLSSRHASFY
ncbi:hypothetical protein T12_1323, partial [Trichinella patagoniensis]